MRLIRKQYKDRPLVDVTDASLRETFGAKRPATYNRLVNVIRAALNVGHAHGWIEAPPKFARRKPPPQLERFLTAAEWKRLRAELPDHLVPMADLSIATGLRWGNVAGLTWDRVDLRRKLAWIPSSQAKGRDAIPVPLAPAAVEAIRTIPGKRAGHVFTYAGKPLGSPKTAWRKAVLRAGLAPLRWHDLRHTWASWHAMNGTPLDVLQKLGGWATRDMVQRYAHLAPSYVAQFAGNAKPVGHKIGHSRAKIA